MGNDTIKEFCYDQNKLNDWIKKQNEQRKIGKYCDYTLKTEDGGSFTAHKNVLASVSPFFEKLFNFDSVDKDKDSVVLKNCSSDVLEQIIEFMYTGKAEVTSDTAKSILDTSLFLGLDSLVDTCTRILVKSASSENCFELLAYAETYFSGEALAKKCIEIIGKNIDKFRESSEFVEMSIDSMKLLCSCDRSLCNDEQLYLAIIKWVKFDMEKREEYISELLDRIRFEEISVKFGIEKILKDFTLWKTQENLSKIMEIISENWMYQLEINENQKIIGANHFESKHLYAVIGDNMLLFDPRVKLFSNLITQFNVDRRRFGYSTFEEKNIFFCGGEIHGQNSDDCNYFSLEERRWKSLPPMDIPRSSNRAITLDKKIYVCGGLGEETVEIFDTYKSKWIRGPSFDRYVDSIGLCLYNETIYGVEKSSLQFLDPRMNRWITLPSLSKDMGNMYSAINYNDYIYGFTFNEIFTFDIRANKWLECITVYGRNIAGNYPRCCMINDEIYVLGKISTDEKLMLNSYQASDLSENFSHVMEVGSSNKYCYALFSL